MAALQSPILLLLAKLAPLRSNLLQAHLSGRTGGFPVSNKTTMGNNLLSSEVRWTQDGHMTIPFEGLRNPLQSPSLPPTRLLRFLEPQQLLGLLLIL
jgi:hypothetical protein